MTAPRGKIEVSLAERGRPAMWANENDVGESMEDNMEEPLRSARLKEGKTLDAFAQEIGARHNLRSLHLFCGGEKPGWRVFGSRGTAAFQASVEEGRGLSIAEALQNLDDRLKAGPINRGPLAPWDELDSALQAKRSEGGSPSPSPTTQEGE